MPVILAQDTVNMPDRPIKNFTTDWNDGVVIAALVDGCAPGLCPEYATMDPENALENASHAMKLADDWLGVPQVSYNFTECLSHVIGSGVAHTLLLVQ